MGTDDLLIAVAYFSIPLQIVISLSSSRRLTPIRKWPFLVVGPLTLFAAFIFLCGVGHILRFRELTDTALFDAVNTLTAIVSVVTSLYLVPILLTNDLTVVTVQQLKDFNDSTEQSKRHMQTFMSFLCHEIRNPLFAITSNIELLHDQSLSESQRSSISSIDQSARLMLRLVNDVLDINKLETGNVIIEENVFDLSKLLDQVARTATLGCSQEVEFVHEVATDTPRFVRGDSTRILQIVYNMVSNAIKFTSQGTIRMETCIVADLKEAKEDATCDTVDETDTMSNEDEDYCAGLLRQSEAGETRSMHSSDKMLLQIQITDTGCGIAEDRLNDIFKPYTQAKLSDYREYGGTGLGLSIVSKLVTLLGGTIHVQSTVGEGSSFTVRLPMEAVEEVVPPQDGSDLEIAMPQDVTALKMDRKSTLRYSSLDRVTDTQTIHPETTFLENDNEDVVLVADDSAMNVRIICKMLAHFGIAYRTASNGKQAVEQIMRSRNITGNSHDPMFAVILLDLCMPVMGGCDAMRLIRSKGIDIPIIALTANAMSESRDDAIASGATDFATKPILRSDLRSRLNKYGLGR